MVDDRNIYHLMHSSISISLLAGISALALSLPATAQNCGTGQTTTTFVANNANYGVMFDIAPNVDMTIECLDLNMWAAGGVLDVEVWYVPVGCAGNETNSAAWTHVATAPGIIGANPGIPTPVDISGNGQVFAGGQTYGIYIQNAQSVTLGYTNGGPTVYTGDHCDITTHHGSGYNWGGGTWREFNGTLYTEPVGPAGPALAASGTAGFVMTFDFTGFGAGETIAIVYGPSIPWATNAPCGAVSLALTPMNFPPTSSLIMIGADANGAAQLVQNVPAGGAGLLVQGVGVGTCGVSNSVIIL